MPSITLRKDGRYMIRKYHNGIRKTIYAKTLSSAKQIYNQFKKNKISLEKETQPKVYTMGNWLDEWAETYKKNYVSVTTYNEIKRVIKQIKENFKNTDIKKITTKSIQTYLNTFSRSRKKEKIITYFNASLEKAKELNIINTNPFNAVVKEKKLKVKRNAFTFKEQEKLINAINNSNIKYEILTYLLTGCRPAELPNKENFDFENNLVKIIGTKNEKSKLRYVEISNKFSQELQEYFKKNKFKSIEYTREQFKVLTTNAGIENSMLYKLRHTFASNHFVLGTKAKQVQQWMGHTSIQMTLDIYTDIDKTCTKEKIHKLYNNLYYEN